MISVETAKKLIVKKKNVVKTPQGWQFNDQAVDLNSKESASVALTRINDEGELDFSSIANYEGGQKEPSNASERSETRSQLSEIELAAGTYAADINLLLNEKIIIPEKEKCTGSLLAKECYKTPKVDYGNNFPEGGLKTNITIDANQLKSSNSIVIYVVSIDLASIPEQERVVEDLDQTGKIEEYSNTYKSALNPTFN